VTGNESLARELALTGRRFTAKEAKDIGFVSRIVGEGRDDVLRAAIEVAAVIAEKSPVAVVGTKHLLNRMSPVQIRMPGANHAIHRCEGSHVSIGHECAITAEWR
jgi:delta(3,5)-delta(2,4)-dienoyl-CoA isomerase